MTLIRTIRFVQMLVKKVWVECCDSHKLEDHEQNYVFWDLELVTVVHALKCGITTC